MSLGHTSYHKTSWLHQGSTSKSLYCLKLHIFRKSNHDVCPYLATNIHRNNISDFDKVSINVY